MIAGFARSCWIATATVIFVLAPVTAGQATRPASEVWSRAVRSLANGLAAADTAQINGMLAVEVSVKPFSGSPGNGLASLIEQAEMSGVVSCRAYSAPAATWATDLAEDFRDCAFVREDQKSAMIPADPISCQRAETTASQWIKAILGVERGEQIGVIVLWIPEKTGELAMARRGRPLFVLVSGDSTDERVNIRKLVYGDPLDGLRKSTEAKKEPGFSSARH